MTRNGRRRPSSAKAPTATTGPACGGAALARDPLDRTTGPRPGNPLLLALLCAAMALATVAAYWGILSNGFVTLDDEGYVTKNEQVQKGLGSESLRWAFSTFEMGNWHPLTWISHMLDVQLFGLDAGKHHRTSLLLHILNAVLLLLLLFRMTGAVWRSTLVAALFALHPLHVESVAWIAERKDVLSTLFWLMTLFAWLAYVRSRRAAPYAAALVLFTLGLMAKPMLVTLPFTLLLLDFWPLGRMPSPWSGQGAAAKRLLWEKAPFFALSTASSIVTVIAQEQAGAVAVLEQVPLAARVINAIASYGAYLAKTVLPSSLSVFYPHSRSDALTGSIVLTLLFLSGVTALSIRLRRVAPHLLFGWCWYLGTLVPVIGLVQVGRQAMADRYTYVPLIGIFISVAWGLAALAGKRRILRLTLAASSVAALALLFTATRIQAGYWRGDETLFTHALTVTPDNAMAHFHVGNVRLLQGRLEEARTHLEAAVRIDPRVGESRNSLGVTLLRLGRTPEGLEHLREARRLNPGVDQATSNLVLALITAGTELVGRKDFAEAVPLFEEASSLADALPPDSLLHWGRALLELGRYEEAADRFRAILARDPASGQAHFQLGYALSQLQRPAEAIRHYREAYGRPGVRSGSFVWIGDIYRRGGLCEEAIQVYRIIPPADPAHPAAAAGIDACRGAR